MSLKDDLKTGVIWTALAKYAGVFITLGVSAVLARLFTPEQFGIINIATVFIAFFSVFSDMGIGPAVIQKNDLTRDDISGVFSLTLWSGVLLSVLFFLASWPISSFYDSPDTLRGVLMVLSLNLLFNSFNMVPNALMMKDKRFKFAAIRQLCVQLICGVVAIAAALMGMGIYALCINPVGSSIIIFFINYFQYPVRPRLVPGMDAIRKVFSFSAFQFGFQLINYFSRNMDKLLMGRYMDMAQLGYYDKSYRLMMMPLQNISYVISPVMHPVFAQIQDDRSRITDAYIKVCKILAYIGFPLSVAMAFMAEDLVLFIFGNQWGPSVPCFRILSLTVGVQIISSSSGAIFQAADSTRHLFNCGLFSAFTNVAAICIGVFAFGTTEAVAWSLCVSFLVNFMQCYHSLFCRTLMDGWGLFWKTLLKPLALSCILAALLWPVSEGVNALLTSWAAASGMAEAGTVMHLVALGIYGIVCLAVCLPFLQISGEFDILGFIRKKLGR